MSSPLVTVVGYLSVDQIICPAGIFENVAGGAACYCAAAAAVAGASVRLVAKVGSDYPEAALGALARNHVDLSGLVRVDSPSRRSRLHDPSGGERVLAHVSDASWWEAIARFEPPLPEGSGIFVYTAMPPELLRRQLLARGGDDTRIVDTSPAYAGRAPAELLALLPLMECFAPSREETRQLFPDIDDDRALRFLSERVPLVVQKRGADGLALKRSGGEARIMSSRATSIIDTTGAGDSVVGALAAAMALGLSDTDLLALCSRIAALAVGGVGPENLLGRRASGR